MTTVKVINGPGVCCSTRLNISIICSMGIVIFIMSRNGINISIINMEEDPNIINLDKHLKGHILSSFFYGYLSTQILAGILADFFGGKQGILFGMLSQSLISLLTPVASYYNIHFLIGLRVLQGITGGFVMPSIYSIISNWSTSYDRGFLMSVTFIGSAASNIINYPLTGLVCQSFLGWTSSFYITGVLGIVWCSVFYIYGSDTPTKHRFVCDQEKTYLVDHKDEKSKTRNKIPWLSILTSVPIFANCFCHICTNWGFYLLTVNMPQFIEDIYTLDLRTNGLLSSLPYIGMLAITPVGKLFDYIRSKNVITPTNLRKIFNTAGEKSLSLRKEVG